MEKIHTVDVILRECLKLLLLESHRCILEEEAGRLRYVEAQASSPHYHEARSDRECVNRILQPVSHIINSHLRDANPPLGNYFVGPLLAAHDIALRSAVLDASVPRDWHVAVF